MKIEFLTVDVLPVKHGFFTRNGGVTEGHLGPLNCGSSFDTKENILENQRRAMEAFGRGFDKLSILKQIHSATVHVVNDSVLPRSLEGDAMVTRTPGMVLGILTADCVPILFADKDAGVIGAAHAGWKGAIGGVVESTVEAMKQLGANHIVASIGACIRQDSYEVGPEFVEQFLKADNGNARYFKDSPKPQHKLFDLPSYVKSRLEKAGISTIGDTGVDTRADEARFFSCRRAFLNKETGFGNGLSAITL